MQVISRVSMGGISLAPRRRLLQDREGNDEHRNHRLSHPVRETARRVRAEGAKLIPAARNPERSPPAAGVPVHRRIACLHSYTYTVVMKNITLSVDENILAAVRRHAAERNSTVNALVREYLTSLAAHEDRAKRARARLRQLSAQSQGRLGKKTWTREDLHDR